MFNKSKLSSYSNMLFFTVLMFGCVVLALPVNSNSASPKHDLNHLMSLIGKLKHAQRLRHSSLDSTSSNRQRGGKYDTIPTVDDAMLLQRGDDDSADFDTEDDDLNTPLMKKRQGAWSFDYGLGGGRFGKRGGYGYDYGLGGGRFGRDVDHVDPNHDIDVAGNL